MFSGEVMPPKTLQYWMQAVPQARFVNLYGPTEITCNCTYHIVQSADEVLQEVPIGRPFANCDVFLLDGGEPVREEGRTGEICVTGSCLSLGYYNRPQLSAQVFVQNPLNSRFREPMYRTGDLGVWKNGPCSLREGRTRRSNSWDIVSRCPRSSCAPTLLRAWRHPPAFSATSA